MILLPDLPEVIISSTPLIRCLTRQVDNSSVYVALPEAHTWMIEGNPSVEKSLSYREKPDELIDEVRDLLPDYLIDLEGKRLFRRLKRKTKILDFCIGRVKRTEANTARERMFRTVHLFDVEDDMKGPEISFPVFNPEWLPEKFLGGFAVLSLDSTELSSRPDEDYLVDLVSLIEKPVVISGPRENRSLAERIGQRTGCTVFPICGDFAVKEQVSILSSSKGVIGSHEFWFAVSDALQKPHVNLAMENLPDLQQTALQVRKWFE